MRQGQETKRGGKCSRGHCLDWSLHSSGNHNLSWWVLIQQTNWLTIVWLGWNLFLQLTFLCRQVIILQHFLIAKLISLRPAAICRASNLSAQGLNASCIPSQVKSQQQFECSKCCSLKLKIENCQVRLFQLVPCSESFIAQGPSHTLHTWQK